MNLFRSLAIVFAMALTGLTACSTTYNVTVASQVDDESEARELYRSINLPTVMIRATGGTGSGVVFGNGKLVLTAAHVVTHRDVTVDDMGNPWYGDLVIEESVAFKNEGIIPFVTACKVLKLDDKLDLAILELSQVYPYASATFANQDPYLYQKCWASGHPHGVTDTTITEGRVQDLWDDGFIRYSALTTFGNSGGPVFIRLNGKFVVSSIVQRVHVEGLRTATTHLGLGCLPDKVRSFIEGY